VSREGKPDKNPKSGCDSKTIPREKKNYQKKGLSKGGKNKGQLSE